MLPRTFHCLRTVIALISVALLSANAFAQQLIESLPSQTYRRELIDIVPVGEEVENAANEKVILLSSYVGPVELRGNTKRLFDLNNNSVKTHVTLFRSKKNPNAYLSLAYLDRGRKNGAGIYRYENREHKFVAHLPTRLKNPTFYQSESGDAFIGCHTGTIYRWDGDQLHNIKVSPELLEPNFKRAYKELEFTSFPGGPVCCYSVADPKYDKHALFDLIVANDDGFKRVSLAKQDGTPRINGPGCMSNANTFRMLHYNRWTIVDVTTGKLTVEKFPIPGDGKNKIKPMKVIALPDGTLISLWRKFYRSVKPNDIDAFDNDRFFRIAEWKKDHWEFAPLGLDRKIAKSHPTAIDAEGGLWIASSEGSLVYRSPNGDWREFGFREGIPSRSVRKMRRIGGWLCLFSGAGHLLRLDISELKEQPEQTNDGSPENPSWQVHNSQTPMNGFGIRPFRIQPLLGVSGKITVLGKDGKQTRRIALPDDDDFVFERNRTRIHSDSRGDAWIVDGDFVARHKDDKWQVITKSETKDGILLNPFEAAARQLIKEGFGPGDFAPQIAFGEGKRVAVASEYGVSFFDGKQWHESVTPNPKTRFIDFFKGNLVLVGTRNIGLRMPDVAWKTPSKNGNYPWETILLRSVDRPMREQADAILKTIPIQKPYRYRSVHDSMVAINKSFIAVYQRGLWSVMPNEDSPFKITHLVDGFNIESDGTLVALNYSGSYTYSILPAASFTVEQGPEKLDVIEDPDQPIKATWKSSIKPENEVHRFRVDGGPWSEWLDSDQSMVPGMLIGKEHTLEIELGSRRRVIRAPPLKYEFTISYDRSELFDQLIKDLSDDRFATRENAEKRLAELGKNLRGPLTKVMETSLDAEVRKRVQGILTKLPRPAGFSD